MNIFKILYLVLCSFILLTACSGDNQPSERLLKNCPLQYKLTDFEEVQKYYAGIITNNSKYIAFKEFSDSGYRLVSLVYSEKQSILSISLPVHRDATSYKVVPSAVSEKIFNDLKGIKKLDGYIGDDMFHPACFIVIKKTNNINTVGNLYNPPMSITKQFDDKNSGLKIYTILNKLVKDYFPDYNEKVNENKSKVIKIGNRSFTEDNYINATKDESKVFMRELLNIPFFEMTNNIMML